MQTYKIISIFNQINNEIIHKKLPVRACFAINQATKELQQIVESFDVEKQKLIEQYAEKDVEGKIKIDDQERIAIDEKNTHLFEKEISELLETDVNVDIPIKITISDLEKCDGEGYDKLTPEDLEALSFLLEEGEGGEINAG